MYFAKSVILSVGFSNKNAFLFGEICTIWVTQHYQLMYVIRHHFYKKFKIKNVCIVEASGLELPMKQIYHSVPWAFAFVHTYGL